MKQTWQEFQIEAPAEGEALFEELMATAASYPGVCGCEQTGTIDETTRPHWSIYLDPDSDPAEFLSWLLELAEALGLPKPIASGPKVVERQNWHDSWREYFRPVNLGKRLAIVPSWDSEALEVAVQEGRLALRLEPGMAFGTGTHATTQLCLILAEEEVQPGSRALDIGTGSGVLAIAAVKLGADSCVGVDLDPEVEDNYLENLRLNNVTSDTAPLVLGPLDQAPQGPYALIFCNMLMHEFAPLLPALPQRLVARGKLLLSGLLATEHHEVVELLSGLPFDIQRTQLSGEWEAMVLVRREDD